MNDIMDQIIESLAFEIEALPNENGQQMSADLYNNPINLKIRVRNKERNKILRQGVISIPNKDNPVYNNENIQLSNSDQTIMSFDVLMDQDDPTNKQKHKRKFRFFKRGSCLGSRSKEDHYEVQKRSNLDIEQRVPTKSTTINDVNKRNFTLTKMYGNSDARRIDKRTHKDILGQCKPGGCLDPPYGEDKYSYVPKLIQMSEVDKNSNNRKSIDMAYQKSLNKNTNIKEKDEISYSSDKKEQLPIPQNINLSNTKHSNSIITYPSITSNEVLNKDNLQKTGQYDYNNRLSHTSNENVETYFISPKKIMLQSNNFQEGTNNNTEFSTENHSFIKPLSQYTNNMNELNQDILKNYEDTHSEENILDPKIEIQSSSNSIEKGVANSTTQFNSLANLITHDQIALNLTKSEVFTRGSLTSLNAEIINSPVIDSLKLSCDPVAKASESPKINYEVSSEITNPYSTQPNNNIEQIENKKETTIKKSSSETFGQDQSLMSTKLDNEIGMTEHEKENYNKENGDMLESESMLASEKLKLIEVLSSIKSLGPNESFNKQNENTLEINNVGTESIVRNVNILDENNNSIHENIITFNEDLKTSSTSIKKTVESSLTVVDIKKSISLTEKDNEPFSEQTFEQKLIDSEIDLNILSNDSIKNAIPQEDAESENKVKVLTEVKEEHGSILSSDINEVPKDNTTHIEYDNLTTMTDVKESNFEVLPSKDRFLQINEHTDLENFKPHETVDKPSISSVKSSNDVKSFFKDSQSTEFRKIQSSTLVTQSLTSMVKKLNKYNTLNNLLVLEPKAVDSASVYDTGLGNSENIDINENSKSNEVMEKISFVKDSLKQQYSFIENIKSASNDSLATNRIIKTPPSIGLNQLIKDKSETFTGLSTNDPTKFENEKKSNDILSANEVNLQNSPKTPSFVIIDEISLNSDIKTEEGLKEELNPVRNLDSLTNDQSSDFHETSATLMDNDTQRKDESKFIHPLLKNSNLKDTIYLNMAFQSFYSVKDGNVIRTIDAANKDVERFDDDNILQFMTLARLDDNPISIPIDRKRKLLLQITTIKEKEDDNENVTVKESFSAEQDTQYKFVAFNEDTCDTFANNDSDKKKIKDTKNSTKSKGNLHLTLDDVYNQKLLPLHKTIQDLKSDIDGLLKQQMLIKEKLYNDKRMQLHKISKSYKACICIEQLLLKH